ncbi:MAG: putative endonuclease 4 [candidate division TM6 bacterium GW2011_GWF2_38_10]|nr:MAG: putative endonuclease 4 [candidate division TM6 bacterium GW2011_GWF2_38_10]
MTHPILVGAHMSIAKSMHLAFERGESIGCTAMQIFTKSSRMLFGKPLNQEEIDLFLSTAQHSSIKNVVAHAGYLINLCAKNETTEQQSKNSLMHELERCAQLGIKNLVFHPGAHVGQGAEQGLKKILYNMEYILDHTPETTQLTIETMAGQGTTLASTFEQIQTLYRSCSQKKRLAVCLDTCHIFSAGYNLLSSKNYQLVIEHFDATIGLEHLAVIHINDSFGTFDSHIDRHAPLGKGKIPLEIFEAIMQDKRLSAIPKILETPTDTSMKSWREEIILLKNFAHNKRSSL